MSAEHAIPLNRILLISLPVLAIILASAALLYALGTNGDSGSPASEVNVSGGSTITESGGGSGPGNGTNSPGSNTAPPAAGDESSGGNANTGATGSDEDGSGPRLASATWGTDSVIGNEVHGTGAIPEGRSHITGTVTNLPASCTTDDPFACFTIYVFGIDSPGSGNLDYPVFRGNIFDIALDPGSYKLQFSPASVIHDNDETYVNAYLKTWFGSTDNTWDTAAVVSVNDGETVDLGVTLRTPIVYGTDDGYPTEHSPSNDIIRRRYTGSDGATTAGTGNSETPANGGLTGTAGAGTDAGTDPGTDSGTDAGTDAGTGEGSSTVAGSLTAPGEFLISLDSPDSVSDTADEPN